MTVFDLTGNSYVTAIPLVEQSSNPAQAWTQWALTQNFGIDNGPKKYAVSTNNVCDWFPTHYTNDTWGYQRPETNYAKGLSKDPIRAWGNNSQYINYTPYLVARPRSDYWQPENLSVFTGNPIEETLWTRAGYCMGIPHVWERYNHALNTDYPTTYTIITPEFSYTPGVYNLTGTEQSATHKFVFNIQVPWKELRGGSIGGYWADTYFDGHPHRDTTFPTFGFSIERDTLWGLLSIKWVCPTEPEWVGEQGEHILGQAITHNPEQNTIKPVFYRYPVIRTESGYVIQLSVSEDKTQVALKFNGRTVFEPTQLPASITNYFRNPPYETFTSDGIQRPNRGVALSPEAAQMCQAAYPSVYTPDFIEAYGTPSMGIGMAMMDNLTLASGHGLPVEDPNHEWKYYYETGPVFGFHKVTKNSKPYFPGPLDPPGTGGAQGSPYYMNRPDGLNSAPPWQNLGSGWAQNINRAALWQRNNGR